MKALQCVELGGPEKLQLNDIPEPEISAEHVIIEVKSASVNFPDVLMIQGLYQFQPPLPFVPGGESAGIVTEVGEGVSDYAVGDKVFAATGVGGISEKILAHQSMLRPIPEEMNFIFPFLRHSILGRYSKAPVSPEKEMISSNSLLYFFKILKL